MVSLSQASVDPPPDFPRVEGDYQITREWRVTLPGQFKKRFEKAKRGHGEDLVLWRSGITCWANVWDLGKDTPKQLLDNRKADIPKDTLETFEFRDSTPLRFGYLLREKSEDAPERWALYTYSIGESGYVFMAIYFDRKADLEVAKKIWFSIREQAKR